MDKSARSLFVRIQSVIPAFLLGRIVYRISRSPRRWLKNILIRGFVKLYRVDSGEAGAAVPDGYQCFNAFFTRTLKADARAFTNDSGAIASPADGSIQQCGAVQGESLLQVKGLRYTLGELLGEPGPAQPFHDGIFVTIYLAPHNYHRVHMPCDGVLRRMVYLPGDRWSVNPRTVAAIDGLFARNERLVFHFDGTGGPFAIVMVGALNVGSMSTAWAGEVLPARRIRTEWASSSFRQPVQLLRGAYLAHFNLGSTVIVVFPRGTGRWRRGLEAGVEIRVGEAIGVLDQGATEQS